MLFVSSKRDRTYLQNAYQDLVSISESRCFSFQATPAAIAGPVTYCHSFNLGIEMLFVSSESNVSELRGLLLLGSFNLGIEMLFVSRQYRTFHLIMGILKVSISESRCFSFQVKLDACNVGEMRQRGRVSISESRCFSFQVKSGKTTVWHDNHSLFQSRNRDAFRFK